MRNYLFVFFFSFSLNLVHAQFGGLIQETQRKLERKITDKVVDALSEELASRAFKPINAAIDSFLLNQYKENSGQHNVDWNKMGEAYGEFLAGLNQSVELPEKYSFDVIHEVETKDYNKKKNVIKLYYTEKGDYLGMENLDDDKNRQFVVMDVQRDAMILYTTDKNGKKTGQAIPNVMKFTSALVNSQNLEPEEENIIQSLAKTGKSKKIAGYSAEEMKGESKDELITLYTSKDVPVSWNKSFSGYIAKFAPTAYLENNSSLQDEFLLEYENKRKYEKNSTSWVTKKISVQSYEILNLDYEFQKFGEE